MVIAGAASGLFVLILIGIGIFVSNDTSRPGPFNTAFSLVNDRGEPVDQSLFSGKPSLVYFGYTNCPEVCPTTLFEMAGWLNQLGPAADTLNAYFFTIDPERDTPAAMHSYVTAFTDRIIGVTGSQQEMQKVIDGWMVHASKLPSSDGNYHMSHTTSLLLIGADGRLKALIPYEMDSQEAFGRIKSVLRIQS